MKPLALLLVGLLLMPLSGRAEDLLQVYRQARSADPTLAAADAARRGVHEGVAQARAPLLPQAGAGFSVEHAHVGGAPWPQDATAADNRSRRLAASVSQTLVDPGALARLDAARAQADAQDAAYRAAEQALLVRVATAYFDVLTARDGLANVRANEDAFRQQVEQAQHRYRSGLSALVDVDQARAYHASARAGTIAAQQALADAGEALAEITGSPPGELRGLREALPMQAPNPADPQAWVAAALAHNPLLQAQRSKLAAAERHIAAARAGHLPTLSAALVAARAAAWPTAAGNDGRTVTTIGLVLNVPLFSGGAQQSRVRQALSDRDGAGDALELRRRRVARDVLGYHRSIVAAIGQIEATRAAVDAARSALASTRVGQGLGTQTMSNLLMAIQTLASAQNEHSLARHRLILSRLLLQQAAGTADENHLAAINALLE